MDPAGSLEPRNGPRNWPAKHRWKLSQFRFHSVSLQNLERKRRKVESHLNAGFAKVDAEAICVPCVVLHLGKSFVKTMYKSNERNGICLKELPTPEGFGRLCVVQ